MKKKLWWAVGVLPLGVLALIVWFFWKQNEITGRGVIDQMAYTLRGIKNNNPMNVEDVAGHWLGVVGNDGRFPKFDTVEHGIRAGMVNYLQDFFVDGLTNLIDLGENNTPVSDNPGAKKGAYGKALADKMGIPPDQPFDILALKYDLAKAIIRNEDGVNPYNDKTIKAGVDQAVDHARQKGWIVA